MKETGLISELLPKITTYALSLDKDKTYTAEIKLYREQRSKDANAYFHVLVNKLARYHDISYDAMKIKMNLEYGAIATDEEGNPLGAIYPKGTNPYDFYKYSKWIGNVKGKFDKYVFYKRTRNLDKKEMAKLIDGVVQEAKDVGIETMTPSELENLKNS